MQVELAEALVEIRAQKVSESDTFSGHASQSHVVPASSGKAGSKGSQPVFGTIVSGRVRLHGVTEA